MSSDTSVIRVKNISKVFRLYQKPQDRLKQMILPKFGRRETVYFKSFEALKSVNLELGRGETVGIVGRNGSGKSTLLQIICGTLTPTEGAVEVRGRIAALLELGAGFNPDFTGRENVYLNGAIIGLSREEIDARFEQIERFADIGQFIDQPTKSYSSGMYVRLAFSVAIHADPDVLIIDEALSVGDDAFQRKCFARIEDMQIKGTTILFVSHSAQAVSELCDRAVLLDGGEVLMISSPKEVIGQYQRLMNLTGAAAEAVRKEILARDVNSENTKMLESKSQEKSREASNEIAATEMLTADPSWYDPDLTSHSSVIYESQGAKILNLAIFNAAGAQVNHLAVGQRYRINYKLDFEIDAQHLVYGFYFKTVSGVELAGANNLRSKANILRDAKKGDTIEVNFDFDCHFMPGTYFLTVGLMQKSHGEYKFLHRIVDALAMHVMEGTNSAINDYGLVALSTSLSVIKI